MSRSSAVLNAGRFDLGFYAGRIYGLLAASFVLVRAAARERQALRAGSPTRSGPSRGTRSSLARHAERLRILHEIDRAMAAEESPEAIAAAVIQPLRELLGVPRAIVNRFDLRRGRGGMAGRGRPPAHPRRAGRALFDAA